MNYYGKARTNYFLVKNADAFQAWAKTLPGVTLVTQNDEKDEAITPNTRFALLSDECDGWPSYRVADDDTSKIDEEVDIIDDIIPFLAENEVAIFMETGHEGMRYLVGTATAVNDKGEVRQISLSNIYEMAKTLVPAGTEVTEATY